MLEVVTHNDVDIYLTLAGTYRIYIKTRPHPFPYCDAWGAFRSTAIRNFTENLSRNNVPFDFSEAPTSWWKD